MNKKEKKLLEKKQQEAKRQALLNQLAQSQLSEERMKQLNSIKDATSSKRVRKESFHKTNETPIEEEVSENIPQQSNINIFEVTAYENENPIQKKTNDEQLSKISESERLEIVAKQLFPDLSFQSFEQKRIPKGQIIMTKELIEEYDAEKDDIYDIDPQSIVNYDSLISDINLFKHHQIERSEEINQERKQLPILAQENDVIDSIKGNLITLISGETGCGKSTQLPQFLYEAGFTEFGAIAITQPRRLAAISLAQRVREETGFTMGREISYQVKHQCSGIDAERMKMKFMTDGILINEMQTCTLLPQYSVVIIDEAHERKVNIDLLIGVLSRIVIARAKVNKPLRLVIMSATLRLEDFLNNKLVFPRNLNLIKVQTRQFPVQVYFNKITKDNYVEAAIEKCLKIHQTLPPGDVLVFLTGQKEIHECCSMLNDRLSNQDRREENEQDSQIEQESEVQQQHSEIVNEDKAEYMELKNVNGPKTTQCFRLAHELSDFVIIPLYSKLEFKNQETIFHNNSSKKRMFVIATNVAETSITIPTIRYVIDAGKQKRKITDPQIGLEKQVVGWISQAAADQRCGRAGRTGPGYCYRLYSTAVYTKFCKFDEPEITQIGLDHTILQMKSIGIRNVFKFPYLTTPNIDSIKYSLNNLLQLGALKQKQETEIITQLGKVLSQIPLSPQYGKFLLQTRIRGVFHYGILLVCILSVDEIINKEVFQVHTQFNSIEDQEDEVKQIEQEQKMQQQLIKDQQSSQQKMKAFLAKYGEGYRISDLFYLLNLIGEAISQITDTEDLQLSIMKAAQQHYLIVKAFKEIYYNVLQILEIFNLIIEDKSLITECVTKFKQYQRPKREEQILLAELLVQTNGLQKVAKLQSKIDTERNVNRYYYTTKEHECVYVHPTSIFHGKWNCEYLSYCSLIVFNENLSSKVYMTNVTEVSNKSILYEMDTRTSLQKKLTVYQDSEFYDAVSDTMMCKGNAVIVNSWTLEGIEIPLPSDQLGFYSKFARVLYKGDVIKFYGALQKYYKYKISDIRESNMQPYSQRILKALMFNQITNKRSLIKKWSDDKQFLLQECLEFVDGAYHGLIMDKWPPLE